MADAVVSWPRAIAAVALVLLVATTAGAAVDGVVLPPEWSAAEPAPAGAELHYSPDLRCRFAAVDAEARGANPEAVWSALRQAGKERGLAIATGSEPVGFERGDFIGAIRLRRLARNNATWQLQACFYRKRNRHVCKPICQKLLG